MSADIFRVKVKGSKTRVVETNELINYCFAVPEFDFDYQNYIELLSIKLAKGESPWNLTYSRFCEILKENHDSGGDDFFLPLINRYDKAFKNLQRSYAENSIAYLSHSVQLIWNNILGELNVKGFKVLPVHEIDIELAQDHDGIMAFPYHRGLGINSIVYREFMIRVLCDLQNQMPNTKQTIANWFNSRGGVLYPEYPERIQYGEECIEFNGDEAIIWGIKEIGEVVIELDDSDFASRYSDSWWVDRIRSNFEYWKESDPKWAEANKEYPFRVKRFSVLLHPAWFYSVKDMVNSEQIYSSTAYGY